jgi:hypothetical protein
LPSARHLSVFWASSIQPMPPIPLLEDPFWYYLPIYAWVSQVVSFPQVSLPKPSMHISFPHTCYMPRTSHYSRFDYPNHIVEEHKSWRSSLCSLLHSPVASPLLGPKSSSASYSRTPSAYVPPSIWETKFHTHTKNRQNWSLHFWIANWETKDETSNNIKDSLTSICS